MEAQTIARVTRAFAEVVGLDTVKKVLQNVNEVLQRESEWQMAKIRGHDSLTAIADEKAIRGQDGSLEETIIEKPDKTDDFDVTGCTFAEKYEELGGRYLGYALSY